MVIKLNRKLRMIASHSSLSGAGINPGAEARGWDYSAGKNPLPILSLVCKRPWCNSFPKIIPIKMLLLKSTFRVTV